MFYNNWRQKPTFRDEFVIYSFRAEIAEGVLVLSFGVLGLGIIFAKQF